jgi:single-stranded-DNA-specific exonuclease
MAILLRRGLRAETEILRHLEPSIGDLESPFAFTDMEKAVARIRRAISASEKILVYGDYDVDGVTAAAILFPILRALGADAEIHLPHRVHEGYGLNKDSLAVWLKRKVGLVITVDNGITGFEAVRYLKDNGVDVILVDHHVPKDAVPPADAIISGSVPGKGNPDSPLAACGLALKLGWALLGDYEKVASYLDLVTLGTVADLAPVEGDNRILLKWGLPRLAKSKRPGIRALMEAARIHPDYLNYRDIAFGLGPRINAAGRMGSPMGAFRLLTTDNFMEARNLAQVLEAGNRERQRVEAEAYREASKFVESKLTPDERHVIVVESNHWHEGVLGIVAARLTERFHRPAIVIAVKEGVGKGSGRSVAGFSLFGHVIQCEEILESFGGHAQACGLSIRQERIPELRKRLNDLASPSFLGMGSNPALWVECEISPADLDLRLLRDLERLAPFGPGNPKPLFLSRGMKLRGDIKKRGKDTLQCWMSDAGEKVTCEVVGFRAYERWQAESKTKREFDIVYQPTLRNSNGISSITLELEAWQ